MIASASPHCSLRPSTITDAPISPHGRALIAMSGGVDSSVAAFLMKERGLSIMGVTLRLFDTGGTALRSERTCCSLDDVEDARSVAFSLDIPYYVFNFGEDFQKKVIDRFVHAYQMGETPNPCIDCNRFIKFDALLHRVETIGYDYLVTGHYAQVAYDAGSGRYLLRKGLDPAKDQSYVLYAMTQSQLAKTRFPLGALTKAEVRDIAATLSLTNADKPDSQDICFVQTGNYRDFLESAQGKPFPKGDFISADGTVLGTHQGTVAYTIGQRKGLGISSPHPLYVVAKDVHQNIVTLGQEADLYADALVACDLNWIACETLTSSIRVQAKIRYHHQAALATVSPGEQPGTVLVQFDQPQRAITPGQAVVFYEDDLVIGGGTIL